MCQRAPPSVDQMLLWRCQGTIATSPLPPCPLRKPPCVDAEIDDGRSGLDSSFSVVWACIASVSGDEPSLSHLMLPCGSSTGFTYCVPYEITARVSTCFPVVMLKPLTAVLHRRLSTGPQQSLQSVWQGGTSRSALGERQRTAAWRSGRPPAAAARPAACCCWQSWPQVRGIRCSSQTQGCPHSMLFASMAFSCRALCQAQAGTADASTAFLCLATRRVTRRSLAVPCSPLDFC